MNLVVFKGSFLKKTCSRGVLVLLNSILYILNNLVSQKHIYKILTSLELFSTSLNYYTQFLELFYFENLFLLVMLYRIERRSHMGYDIAHA